MPPKKRLSPSMYAFSVFPSHLGWMAVVVAGRAVKQLTFGHPSPAAAKKALDRALLAAAEQIEAETPLVERLRAYAAGNRDSFRNVPVDLRQFTPFQQRILKECRRIPPGGTISYAELALKAGFPHAARAVGNCMAANPIPLIIPCHRVVRYDGQPGSYSAPGGVAMKRRLLALESRKLA